MQRRLFAFVVTLSASCLLTQSAGAGIKYVGAELVNISPNPDYVLSGDVNHDGLQDVVLISLAWCGDRRCEQRQSRAIRQRPAVEAPRYIDA